MAQRDTVRLSLETPRTRLLLIIGAVISFPLTFVGVVVLANGEWFGAMALLLPFGLLFAATMITLVYPNKGLWFSAEVSPTGVRPLRSLEIPWGEITDVGVVHNNAVTAAAIKTSSAYREHLLANSTWWQRYAVRSLTVSRTGGVLLLNGGPGDATAAFLLQAARQYHPNANPPSGR